MHKQQYWQLLQDIVATTSPVQLRKTTLLKVLEIFSKSPMLKQLGIVYTLEDPEISALSPVYQYMAKGVEDSQLHQDIHIEGNNVVG